MMNNVLDGHQRLSLLYEVSTKLNRCPNDPEKFNDIVTILCSQLNLVSCSIWIINGIGQQRLAYFQRNDEGKDYLPNLDFLACSRVIKEKKPLLFCNMNSNPMVKGNNYEKLWVTGLPLVVDEQLVGIVCYWGISEFKTYDKEYWNEVYQSVAGEIAYGVFNYRYYSGLVGKRLKKELNVARQIQQELIPHQVPNVTGISLGLRSIMANEVGGDYADLFVTENKQLGIAIGDVMGKGIPAALWMAMTRVTMRATAIKDAQPHIALGQVNSLLYPELIRDGTFVTLFYALFDPVRKTLLFSNAGHLPPIVYRSKTGKVESLKLKGPYIGAMEYKKYQIGGIQLHKGDIVLFYTDGLVDAINPERKRLGIENLIEILSHNHIFRASEIVDRLSYYLGNYICSGAQTDDVTFMVLKVE